MIKILIVEDDSNKLQKITQSLLQVDGVELGSVTNEVDATSAKIHLSHTFFDLLVLDIAIPERIDQEVAEDGGLQLLDEVLARDKYKQPGHVIGITGFADIYEKAKERFSRESLTVIYYDLTSAEWSYRLQAKLKQVVRSNRDRQGFEDSKSGPSSSTHSGCALVMKGGGVKTLAYVGALKVLEKYYTFDWFIGTSGGAIAAALLGAGFQRDELEELLKQKDFSDFLDSPGYMLPLNLLFHKGLYHARTLTSWLDKLMAQKLRSVSRVKLNQLPHRVTIYASRRGKKALVFDSEDPQTGNVAVSHAVRCSMSIPFIFIPQREEGLKVFDGGLQNNYPVSHLLENHPKTNFLGLYLGSELFEGEDRDPSLFKELLSIWSESNDAEALEKHRQNTIIIDPRPIRTIDFHLNSEEKEFLLRAGEAAATRFLSKSSLANGSASSVTSAEENLRVAKDAMDARRKRWWRQ